MVMPFRRRFQISKLAPCCHEGMESYLLALQLRTASSTGGFGGRDATLTSLVAKMILFGEVASALLMIPCTALILKSHIQEIQGFASPGYAS